MAPEFKGSSALCFFFVIEPFYFFSKYNILLSFLFFLFFRFQLTLRLTKPIGNIENSTLIQTIGEVLFSHGKLSHLSLKEKKKLHFDITRDFYKRYNSDFLYTDRNSFNFNTHIIIE